MANWFDNGIKRITGESIYYTEIGGTDSSGFHPVTRLGTVFKFPIAMIRNSAGTITFDDALEFIVHSGTKVILRPADQQVATTSKRRNMYEVYDKTPNELNSNPIESAWFTSDVLMASSPGGRTYVQRHKPLPDTGYYAAEAVDTNYRTYGFLQYTPDVYELDARSFWRRSITSTSADNYIGYSNISRSSDGNKNYIDVVLINDASSNRLAFLPLIYGYNVIVSDDIIDIYSGTYLMAKGSQYTILGTIPYSWLNDSRYFNPEEDGTDPRPDDGPDFGGDTSVPGGGDGNYLNYPSDDIGLPALPTIGAIDTGFLTMYNPSIGQLQNLVDYLWTSDWIDTIKKMVSNPMDAIISLQLAPYEIGLTASSTCKIGAVNTEIPMAKVAGQYQTLSAGTVKIPEHWGNALDYNNVNISVYIPFVGVRTIDTNLCMNSTLSLTYYIDKLTGSAIAMLMVSKANTSNSIYYTYDCNVNYQIPITGANYAETIKAIMSLTASSVGMGASLATGNMGGAMTAGASMIGSAFMAGSGACHYEGSGNLSANTGILGQFIPYVIVELPKQSLPKNFSHLKGYTSNITANLGSLSGFTMVEAVHVENIPGATDTEKQMIEDLLMRGVIL